MSKLGQNSLAAMRPHLVNLSSGKFSDDGKFKTSPEDVDAIFEEHLPLALDKLTGDGKLQLLFYAHGGLVSEMDGLLKADEHINWWVKNGVYPIYFIWETGFFESIGQLLERASGGARAVTRDVYDYTFDPIIETAVRLLGGPKIWGVMKWSAERASKPGGAAQYVAQKLKIFCENNRNKLELHAIGHSAGSIFHAHFLATCKALSVPVFNTLQLLAPAIRSETFKQLLLPGLNKGEFAASVSMFTMDRNFERSDHCGRVYNKSLLYLLFHALEDKRGTPILGLEDSLRSDPELRAFFGLGGTPGKGEIIWSTSTSDSGRSASRSVTHGGFDDDAPTMNSVARRILGVADEAPIDGFPVDNRAPGRDWTPLSDRPSDDVRPSKPETVGGRRIALCMGVDAYPDPLDRLYCCANDAKAWAEELSAMGFEVRLLLDEQVTRAAMDRELHRLVTECRAGDVIVVQYAGHGTHLNDLNSDEEDGQDEALCPVDYASGALYIDDDIADVLDLLPEGVNLTLFMDCCHSATNTRFAAGSGSIHARLPAGARARYVKPTPGLQQAHAAFRGQSPSRSVGSRGQKPIRHVKFAACQDGELAIEIGGNGLFTRHALHVLRSQRHGTTNEGFLQAVLTLFGNTVRQRPALDCADASRSQLLLQPFRHVIDPVAAPHVTADSRLVPVVAALAEAVRLLAPKPGS